MLLTASDWNPPVAIVSTMITDTAKQTTSPIQIPERTVPPTRPEFIRLPKVGRQDPHTGLTRSAMNDLILPSEKNGGKPPVKSFVLRQRGARKGIRLISYESLLNYILERPQEEG